MIRIDYIVHTAALYSEASRAYCRSCVLRSACNRTRVRKAEIALRSPKVVFDEVGDGTEIENFILIRYSTPDVANTFASVVLLAIGGDKEQRDAEAKLVILCEV